MHVVIRILLALLLAFLMSILLFSCDSAHTGQIDLAWLSEMAQV